MSEDRRRMVVWVGTHIMPSEPAARAWLRRSLVSQHDIDDLIQEAYCKLLSLDSVDHITEPGAYFFRIVRMLLLAQIRRSRIVRIETGREIDLLSFSSDQPSPERITMARRELEKVRRLIEALPDRCRRIFELRKIQGVPQREIARIMGVTESIVENDVVKGLRLVMQGMREHPGPIEGQMKASDEATRNRRRD